MRPVWSACDRTGLRERATTRFRRLFCAGRQPSLQGLSGCVDALPCDVGLSAVVLVVIVEVLSQLVHVAAILAHGSLGDAALFLPVAVFEVLRERLRGFRGAFSSSFA